MPTSTPTNDGEGRGNGSSRRSTPSRPTVLVLVRHAVTEQTGPLLSGRTPGIDLSERGRQQADAVAHRLEPLPVAAVYASPIERTLQTARAIAARHGLRVRSLRGVLEADYGEWTGRKLRDLARTPLWRVVQATPSLASFPGGESIVGMQSRAVLALDEVVARHPGGTIVVVSHSDVIKAAVAHYAGMHLDLFQRIVVSPASVTVLAFGAGAPMLVKLNDAGSLADLASAPERPARRGRAR